MDTKEHPILFSQSMVRAILEGHKTQTRRVLTPRNTLLNGGPWYRGIWEEMDFTFDGKLPFVDPGPSPAGNSGPYLHVRRPSEGSVQRVYPRVQVRDLLWGRETWHTDQPDLELARSEHEDVMSPSPIFYRADRDNRGSGCRWRPGIHMPRWASRLILDVWEIKIQRVQDISEIDATAEGLVPSDWNPPRGFLPMWTVFEGEGPVGKWFRTPRDAFRALWDSINGKKEGRSWDDNPWVLAYTFERRTP